MQGIEGTGKSIFWTEFYKFVHGHYCRLMDDVTHMTGHFNPLMDCSMSVLFEEFELKTYNSRDTADTQAAMKKLKHWITDDDYTLHAKGKDHVQRKQYSVFMGVSNHDVPLDNMSASNRRFLVIKSSPHRKGDFAYFNEFAEIMKSKTRMLAFCHLLMLRDVSNFNYGTRVPTSSATTESVMAGLDPVSRWWYDTLCAGVHISKEDNWLHTNVNTPWQQYVSFQQLYEDFTEGGNTHITLEAFRNKLISPLRGDNRFGLDPNKPTSTRVGVKRKDTDGKTVTKRVFACHLLPLDQAIQQFQGHFTSLRIMPQQVPPQEDTTRKRPHEDDDNIVGGSAEDEAEARRIRRRIEVNNIPPTPAPLTNMQLFLLRPQG